jgi:general stress protein 26
MSQPTEKEQRKALHKIINGARTAFMVTKTPNGRLHGRPMATAELEENFTSIWFASQRDSGKLEELRADNQVFLGYNNASGSEWATINGRVNVVDDRAKIHELWNPFWKNWFEGPDDPNLVLLEVEPETAEYWDSGSKALIWAKFAITAVTGKKMDEGDHAKLDLNRGR